jgi:hypothetical protein
MIFNRKGKFKEKIEGVYKYLILKLKDLLYLILHLYEKIIFKRFFLESFPLINKKYILIKIV